MGFVKVKRMDAVSITDTLLSTLQLWGLDMSRLVVQASACSRISTNVAIPVLITAVRMPTVLKHLEASTVPVTLDIR